MLITRNSLRSLELSIVDLEKQLKEVRKNKAMSVDEGVGDGWHDNFAFEQATMQETMILKRIADLRKLISESELIDQASLKGDVVTIGSKVKIRISDDNGGVREQELLIVDIKTSNVSNEATINSPIGQAILYKKVGEIGEYTLADGREFEVEVLSINNN